MSTDIHYHRFGILEVLDNVIRICEQEERREEREERGEEREEREEGREGGRKGGRKGREEKLMHSVLTEAQKSCTWSAQDDDRAVAGCSLQLWQLKAICSPPIHHKARSARGMLPLQEGSTGNSTGRGRGGAK